MRILYLRGFHTAPLVFVSLISNLQGQPVLMLDDAVREALEAHPLIQAETGRVATAGALVQQAGVRPNPRLFIQSENWNFPGNPPQPIASTFTDQFFYASQVLETAGKRQRRIDLAQENVRVTQSDREILSRQIALRVKLAYWSALGAERVVELLLENKTNLQQTVEYHENQFREGAIAEADVIRVRLEEDRAAVAVENARREADLARVALWREMGRETFADAQLGEMLESIPAPPPLNIDAALANRPEVHHAQQAIEQARAGLSLQQAVARPDVEVLSGYKRTAGYNTFMWGAQVNLPFFNKNQGNIAAATSDIAVAEANLKAIQARIRGEVEAASRDVDSRRQRLSTLIATTLARANQSAGIARAAYREGGSDLLRLLDAERVNIEAELTNARTLTEYHQSLSNLEMALGVNP